MFDLKSQKSDLSNYIVYMDECLLAEIFSRLPVKSVCQMRCVCKSWNSLISSSFFIAHYHHQTHHRKSYLLLKKKGKAFRYALYYPGQGAPFDHITTFNSLSFDPFPFRTRQQHHHLIFNDLIHGVLCLTSDPSSSPTILWNPSLQKYVEIPNSPFQFDGSYNKYQYAPSLGFGFNSRTDDYIIMRLWTPIQRSRSNKLLPLVYEVFSPRNGVWRMAFPTRSIRPGKVISKASFFMNGVIHWIISANKAKKGLRRGTTEYYRLLMFDCEREEFTTMKLPQGFNQWRYEFIRPSLFRWRGKLSVMISTSSTVDLWVMSKYGVARTWKNLPYGEGRSEYFGLVSDESMFLMHVKNHAVSYAEKQDCDDGKVGSCQHILI